MSVENVSVSMSRLRIAKAIKTSDDPEDEPWMKSILFYQSHISPGMRKALVRDFSLARPPDSRPIRSPRSGKKKFIPKDSDSESENDNDDSSSEKDDDNSHTVRILEKQRGHSETNARGRPMGKIFDQERVAHPWSPSTRQNMSSPMLDPWHASYYMQLQLYQQHHLMQQAVLATRQMMISGNSAKVQRGRDLMVQQIKDRADLMARRSPQRTRQNKVAPRPPGVIMAPYRSC